MNNTSLHMNWGSKKMCAVTFESHLNYIHEQYKSASWNWIIWKHESLFAIKNKFKVLTSIYQLQTFGKGSQ